MVAPEATPLLSNLVARARNHLAHPAGRVLIHALIIAGTTLVFPKVYKNVTEAPGILCLKVRLTPLMLVPVAGIKLKVAEMSFSPARIPHGTVTVRKRVLNLMSTKCTMV